MADGFQVQPDELRTEAKVFGELGATLSRALNDLDSALSGLSGMCGDDKQGRQLAAKYDPNQASIGAAVARLSEGVISIQGGLEAMADNHQSNDQAKAESFRVNGAG